MEKAELLVVAYRLDPKGHAWALQAARDQWHWVLGRNANGFSMVTQIGKSPTRMYHAEWGRAATMPPGYLVGGPDSHDCGFLAPGAPAKALFWDNPQPLSDGTPAHALWHNGQQALWEGGFLPPNDWRTGWYAVNEPDIYYNSNLVLVAAEMQE
jgi:hypothetical protein